MLNNSSLNPKTQITSKLLIDADIMEMFGEAKVLMTTNLALDPTMKLEMLHLYVQCYGHNNVTNIEFYLWFVKGYIAQEKSININWANVVASIAREKLRREEIAKWKLVHGVAFGSCSQSGRKSLVFLTIDDNVMI
jgi:hypothetical protein